MNRLSPEMVKASGLQVGEVVDVAKLSRVAIKVELLYTGIKFNPNASSTE